MRVTAMVIGFLATVAITGVTNVPESLAVDGHRVDVIDALHETVAQADSVKAGSERMRVDIIENIEPEGPGYPYGTPMNH